MDVSVIQERVQSLFPGLLGIRFLEATPERVRAELTVSDELCTVPGVIHGGAIMALADTLGGVATTLSLPPGAGTATIESKTNFFAPGRVGETITGECSALHRGKRTMVWQTRVTSNERLIAVVTQSQMVLEAQQRPEEVMAALVEGKSAPEQKALLATLERSGAALYRSLAADETEPAAREELLRAAGREEANARMLEEL